jgi:hypothetical protein
MLESTTYFPRKPAWRVALTIWRGWSCQGRDRNQMIPATQAQKSVMNW